MIAVTVDMSQASQDEIEAFYATPGVARAVDEWAQASEESVQIWLREPHEPLPCESLFESSH